MEHTFATPILRFEEGMIQHYIPVPTDIASDFKLAGIRRVIASINGMEVRRAILSKGEGERYLALNKQHLRDLKAQPGEVVVVVLTPDPHPEDVGICEEFAIALEQDEEAAARFYSFTPGVQRSLASYITNARREETRIKRSLEIARKLRTYTMYGDSR